MSLRTCSETGTAHLQALACPLARRPFKVGRRGEEMRDEVARRRGQCSCARPEVGRPHALLVQTHAGRSDLLAPTG